MAITDTDETISFLQWKYNYNSAGTEQIIPQRCLLQLFPKNWWVRHFVPKSRSWSVFEWFGQAGVFLRDSEFVMMMLHVWPWIWKAFERNLPCTRLKCPINLLREQAYLMTLGSMHVKGLFIMVVFPNAINRGWFREIIWLEWFSGGHFSPILKMMFNHKTSLKRTKVI